MHVQYIHELLIMQYFMRAFGSTRLLSSSEVLTGVYSDHFPTWGSAWIR